MLLVLGIWCQGTCRMAMCDYYCSFVVIRYQINNHFNFYRMQPTLIAANWKMHNTLSEGQELTSTLISWLRKQHPAELQIILLPSFIHLTAIHSLLASDLPLALGAQNCHEKASGAFTGEVSSAMLSSAGVQYVLVGHSERRGAYKEGHELLAAKVDAALGQGIRPIFCCGEPWHERTHNTHEAYIAKQLEESLLHLSPEQISQVIIAYEPVWAIGTGEFPDADAIVAMQKAIRAVIAGRYTAPIAEDMRLLYGGSCNAQNVKSFLAIAGIDGVLVGNASVQAKDFLPLLEAVS